MFKLNKYTGFHLLLLFALAAAAASTIANQTVCIVAFALLLLASIFFASKFEKDEKEKARTLILLSCVLAAIIFSSRLMASQGFTAVFPAIIALLIVYYAFKRAVTKNIRAKVVGEHRGYLMIEILPSIIAAVPSGVYAVKSDKKFREGEIVAVELSKSFFSPAKPVRVTECRKKE